MDHDHFVSTINSYEPRLESLLASQPVTGGARLPREANGLAVYLFSQGSTPTYVGRSGNVRSRYACHCGRDMGRNESSFARRLVTQQSVLTFGEAYSRIRAMEFRWHLIDTEADLHLFEMYAAYRLKTPFFGVTRPAQPA